VSILGVSEGDRLILSAAQKIYSTTNTPNLDQAVGGWLGHHGCWDHNAGREGMHPLKKLRDRLGKLRFFDGRCGT